MKPFQRKLITTIGISIAIVAVLSGALAYLAWKVNTLSNEVSLARKENIKRSAMLAVLAAMKSEYEGKAKAEIGVLHRLVPEQVQLLKVGEDVRSFASAAGLSSSFLLIDEVPATKGNIGSFRFKLDLRGDLGKLISFMKTLLDFKYLTEPNSLAMARVEGRNEADLRGRVYFRKTAP